MSTKFEQLLDYLVNEEHEKANELFHEIVVEKSREIYENLISEEDQEDMEEGADDEQDESVEEGADDEQDESMELEDSYMMDGEEEHGMDPADPADKLGLDAMDADEPSDDEHDHEGQEDAAIMDIKNAIAELEAAFAELERAQGDEESEMDMDADADDEEGEGEDEDMMGMMEGRRITREYVEKVGNDWDKSGTQKAQGKNVGAGSGDTEGGPAEGKSPVSSGKGKPTTGADAKNLAQGGDEGQSNTGTSPGKVNKGITPEKGDKFASEAGNVPGGKMGVKNLKKVGSGYPNNNKTPGPVGAGTGDKAGQTSIDPATKKQFLPQHTK